MELNDKTNEKYLNDKKAFQKIGTLEEKIKQTKVALKTITREIEDASISKTRAEEDGDKNKVKEANKKLEKLQKNKEELLKGKFELDKEVKEKTANLNKYIEEIEKDPELKNSINEAMKKTYSRELKRAEEEQKELLNLRLAINEHPEIENKLKGMIRAKEEIAKIDIKLESLEDKKEIRKLIEDKISLKEKYNLNKSLLEKTIEKNNLNISIDFVEKLIEENDFAHSKVQVGKDEKGKPIFNDEINANKTLRNIYFSYDKNINKTKRQIAKLDKDEGIELESEKNEIEYISEKTADTSLIKQEKILWWKHPILRFKQWREERKDKEVEIEDKTEDEVENLEQKNPNKKEKMKFRDAYKYEVVQDYVKQKDEEIKKEVNQEMKARKKAKREEEEKEEEK